MKEPLQSFLKEGVKVYWEATSTIRFFEGQMREILDDAVASRRDWQPLMSHKFTVSRPGGGTDGKWISCLIRATDRSGDGVEIDCGLWWNAPKCPVNAIVYCSFFEQPKDLLGFKHERGGGPISSFQYRSRTILYSPIPVDLSIGAVLNAELDCLLKQLSS